MKKRTGISRLDQASKKTHGEYVRIRFNGETHCKFFADSKYGPEPADTLKAAIEWRDTKEKEIGRPRTDKSLVTKANNNTGVVGVRHNEKLNRYEVSWVTAKGKQGKTSVSIKKHGLKSAFRLAKEIRKQREKERVG